MSEAQSLEGNAPDWGISCSFRKLWIRATDDNYFALFGFQRFRTSHLFNLRFLEEEITQLDHRLFQTGLSLNSSPYSKDKLGPRHGKIDGKITKEDKIINQQLVLDLRSLLKQYDEALASFNKIMMMETFALADNSSQSRLRDNLNSYKTYKTRLIRVDLRPRDGSRDFLRHYLRRWLRALWFFVLRGKNTPPDSYAAASDLESNIKQSYQNTAQLAEVITRFVVAVLAGAFLVIPMVVLSNQTSKEANLATVSVCIVIFSLLVSLVSKATNEQTMAASAAYAAVLVVFLANSPA